VKLANNKSVVIVGTARVKLSGQGEKHKILVYILGTSYLIENKISIDFGNYKAAICNLFNLTGKYTNLEFSEP
jgi:hypothetical protein